KIRQFREGFSEDYFLEDLQKEYLNHRYHPLLVKYFDAFAVNLPALSVMMADRNLTEEEKDELYGFFERVVKGCTFVEDVQENLSAKEIALILFQEAIFLSKNITHWEPRFLKAIANTFDKEESTMFIESMRAAAKASHESGNFNISYEEYKKMRYIAGEISIYLT
ncbi:MAG: hypothetical protein NZ108_03595, partial [Bacteroidia bacterium]|nr:hypothetical protein [Bacteroidia bacterium]